MIREPQRYYTPLLAFLLVTCIACFWIPLLSESFWIDETVTAFVLRHGATHPSLAASARLDQTIYYWLPQISQSVLGFSEFSLRLPSLLVTLLSMWMMTRIAARFIHPEAGWFIAFLCFIPHEFTRQATDARPYGLGTFVAVAAIWFLIRWLDSGRWPDAILHLLFASMLLRVHLIYWPFYAVFGCYALMRRIRRETPVSWIALTAVWTITIASIIPMIPVTMQLSHSAKTFVAIPLPNFTNILSGFQFPMIVVTFVTFRVLARVLKWPHPALHVPASAMVLLAVWWLWQPFSLLAASWVTGNSVFQTRYMALALPGMMLVCTLIAASCLPVHAWKPVALVLGFGVLIVHFVKDPFPPTRYSHWREAAARVNSLTHDSEMPVFCLSPFVEAKPPSWYPGYQLPGFLYSHLDMYPVHCTLLLPNRMEPQGEGYAQSAVTQAALGRRFLLYGGISDVVGWAPWFGAQPELAGWNRHLVGRYGDAGIVLFEPGRQSER